MSAGVKPHRDDTHANPEESLQSDSNMNLAAASPPVNSGNRAKIMLPSNSSANLDYSCSDNAIPFEFPMLLWKVRLGIFKNNRINSSFQSRFKESKNINKTIISHFIFPTKIPDTKTDLIIFLLRAFLIAFPFKKFNSEKWDEFRFPIILYQGI